MMISRPRLLTAIALVTPLMLLCSPAAFAASPASPEQATIDANSDRGITNAIDGHDAMSMLVHLPSGATTRAFCIQLGVPLDRQKPYASHSWAGLNQYAVAKAAWLATKSPSVGTALTDQSEETAAEQIAIWHLTDNLAYAGKLPARVQTRIDALLAAARNAPQGTSSWALNASAALADQAVTIVSHVSNDNGVPLAGRTVDLTVGSIVMHAVTNGAGDATSVVAATSTSRTATVTLHDVLTGGSVLTGTGTQTLLTTSDVPVMRQAQVTLPALGAADPAPSAGSSTAPVAASGGAPAAPVMAAKSLPFTGPSTTTTVLVGALALAGAGVIVRRVAR